MNGLKQNCRFEWFSTTCGQQLMVEIEWGNLDQTGLEVLEFVAKSLIRNRSISIPKGSNSSKKSVTATSWW
ncbi:hypothetical protein O9993_18785 [Vibrio lentus]|nr:hypothetical protein [Vibrio lentus]